LHCQHRIIIGLPLYCPTVIGSTGNRPTHDSDANNHASFRHGNGKQRTLRRFVVPVILRDELLSVANRGWNNFKHLDPFDLGMRWMI
jgi:hypothetical protein